nr:MAG TPA: hypothetical protein [Caudoviricetes sp.]
MRFCTCLQRRFFMPAAGRTRPGRAFLLPGGGAYRPRRQAETTALQSLSEGAKGENDENRGA